MTAILAIESGKLDETVKVSENAVRAEGSSIYLKPGEKIKLRRSCLWINASLWK